VGGGGGAEGAVSAVGWYRRTESGKVNRGFVFTQDAASCLWPVSKKIDELQLGYIFNCIHKTVVNE
jgi:hypothetical protein